jgi:predicted phosphoribosyltransferase
MGRYPVFGDRGEAGRRLGKRLGERAWSDPVVLGLARGGVPVAAEVARALHAPLEVLVSRKIGAPGHPEFGVGAVTSDGVPTYDDLTLRALGLTPEDLRATYEYERAEAARREHRYRAGREFPALRGRDVLVIDDGLATGVTARAAIRSLRAAEPRRVVFAAPVCAPDSAAALGDTADEVICLSAPPHFQAVGNWYRDFSQTSDDEVIALLKANRR